MPSSSNPINVQLDSIGHLISDKMIEIPHYQRSFAWEESQVKGWFRDINDAICTNAPEYFLGTIVLTPASNGKTQVLDGQQRIATTLVFIAAIRNYLNGHSEKERARVIESNYIARHDLRTMDLKANIVLNENDNAFFQSVIIANKSMNATTESHKRIAEASEIADQFVESITKLSKEPVPVLIDWLDYIDEKAKVIVVDVSSEANAYTIFEVLNDRGIDLSIADLLKNYLFRISDTRLRDVQDAWTSMRSKIESEDRVPSIITFIRHVWSSKHGLTRERELYDSIKKHVTGRQQAVDLVNGHPDRRIAILGPKAEDGAKCLQFGSGQAGKPSVSTGNHRQSTPEERDAIQAMNQAEMSIRAIARLIHRAPWGGQSRVAAQSRL